MHIWTFRFCAFFYCLLKGTIAPTSSMYPPHATNETQHMQHMNKQWSGSCKIKNKQQQTNERNNSTQQLLYDGAYPRPKTSLFSKQRFKKSCYFLQTLYLGFVFGSHLLLAAALSAWGEAHSLLLRDVPLVAENSWSVIGIKDVPLVTGKKNWCHHQNQGMSSTPSSSMEAIDKSTDAEKSDKDCSGHYEAREKTKTRMLLF